MNNSNASAVFLARAELNSCQIATFPFLAGAAIEVPLGGVGEVAKAKPLPPQKAPMAIPVSK
jgi:hypothetical protein